MFVKIGTNGFYWAQLFFVPEMFLGQFAANYLNKSFVTTHRVLANRLPYWWLAGLLRDKYFVAKCILLISIS